MEAHADDLRAEVNDDSFVDAFKRDWRRLALAPAEHAMLDYAERLTRTPWQMRAGDVEGLRRAGLTDEQISDATQVISYFNYINRVADGLGVDLEEFMPPDPRERDRPRST